jgi:hypothetical protein
MDEENSPITITGYSKEIANAAKIYTEEQKYSSINKSLTVSAEISWTRAGVGPRIPHHSQNDTPPIAPPIWLYIL